MISTIVHSMEPVFLVGGGKHRAAALKRGAAVTRRFVAADSGADWLVGAGVFPEHVIGDLDSVRPETLVALGEDRTTRVEEQDSTDFEKCLARIAAPLVLGAGFIGGRADHELAAYHGLARFAHRPTVLIGPDDAICLAPPRLEIDLSLGSRFSLFPLARLRARSRGLRWDVDEVRFAPGEQIGTSNLVTGPVRLEADSPRLLVIVPVAALEMLCTALLEAVPWPEPHSAAAG
ncbi:thiamine diphosphokinase [Rhodobacteraceae bacterium 63075]|nr:thiamine diphosphokinase [Rhodobacteraceae bacterium 63075]